MLKVLRRRERGQVLVMAALLVPVLLAMTGMAIDAGRYASDRRSLQNAADAIALAAAQQLCAPSCTDYDAAVAAGDAILDKYDINPDDVTITGSGGNTAPQVTVQIRRPHNFIFMRVVGISTRDVEARARALKVSFGGGEGVVPWGLEESVAGSVPWGAEVIMKYDANSPENGNFGPVRIDAQQGTGSKDYENGVAYGSGSNICAESTPGCDPSSCASGSFPSPCAEDADGCVGPECKSKTGNMVGATKDAVDFRMNNTSATCDSFNEVFTLVDASSGKYRLNNACNPWIDGPGKCADDKPGTLCSRRVFIIPIIDEFGNGSGDVTVVRFALMFLEGYDSNKCKGSACEIKGRFVKADINTGSLSGIFDPQAPIQYVRLAE